MEKYFLDGGPVQYLPKRPCSMMTVVKPAPRRAQEADRRGSLNDWWWGAK